MIRFPCHCGKVLLVKEEFQGKAIKCPECHATVKVPEIHHAALVGAGVANSTAVATSHSPNGAQFAHAEVIEESTGHLVADSVDSMPTKPLPLPFSVVVIQFAAWLEVIASLSAISVAIFGPLEGSAFLNAMVLGGIGLLSCPFLFALAYTARTVHRLEEEVLGPRKIVMKKRRSEILKKVKTEPRLVPR